MKIEINHKYLISTVNVVGFSTKFTDDYNRIHTRYIAYPTAEDDKLFLNSISLKLALMSVKRPFRKIKNIIYSEQQFAPDQELTEWLSYFTNLEFQNPIDDQYLNKVLAYSALKNANYDSLFSQDLE